MAGRQGGIEDAFGWGELIHRWAERGDCLAIRGPREFSWLFRKKAFGAGHLYI